MPASGILAMLVMAIITATLSNPLLFAAYILVRPAGRLEKWYWLGYGAPIWFVLTSFAFKWSIFAGKWSGTDIRIVPLLFMLASFATLIIGLRRYRRAYRNEVRRTRVASIGDVSADDASVRVTPFRILCEVVVFLISLAVSFGSSVALAVLAIPIIYDWMTPPEVRVPDSFDGLPYTLAMVLLPVIVVMTGVGTFVVNYWINRKFLSWRRG